MPTPSQESGKKRRAVIHKTVPIRVWVDVDVGVAKLVKSLNRMEGIRTLASCQGTIGEGGADPYDPHVMISWERKKHLAPLLKEFKYQPHGFHYGTLWVKSKNQ